MAFCPDCEAEYRSGVTVCPDCEVELVPELTQANRVHDISESGPVKLRSFSNSAEAEMVRETLGKNGIRAFVEGGDFAVIPSSFSQEVVVMVDERDLARAVEIYEAYFDAESTAPAEEDQTDKE
jgi:Putative prokaryotic signal transducing protein